MPRLYNVSIDDFEEVTYRFVIYFHFKRYLFRVKHLIKTSEWKIIYNKNDVCPTTKRMLYWSETILSSKHPVKRWFLK